MMLAVGAWRYYILIGANDTLWAVVATLGGFGFVLALLFPAAWRKPEQALSVVGQKLGTVLFKALLTLVYVLLITPVGLLLRKAKGSDPIYAWDETTPALMEGWHQKEVLFETNIGQEGKPNVVRRLVIVLQFFVRRGHYIILPTLVILIALGMVLFFVKSSALAPFIYTLF